MKAAKTTKQKVGGAANTEKTKQDQEGGGRDRITGLRFQKDLKHCHSFSKVRAYSMFAADVNIVYKIFF